MDAQLKRGYLEVCVLASMLKEETYGYKLIKDISPYIEISESTLYPILKRLEASGCVTVRTAEFNSRLRKYYFITSVGKEKIQEFLLDWQSILRVYEYIEEASRNDEN